MNAILLVAGLLGAALLGTRLSTATGQSARCCANPYAMQNRQPAWSIAAATEPLAPAAPLSARE